VSVTPRIVFPGDENHLVGAITHPAYQEFSKLQGPIQNDIIDGNYHIHWLEQFLARGGMES